MPSLTLSDRLIWFAHCPKAGGTSIEQFMVARWGSAVGHLHWGWDLWWRNGGWRVADPPNSPQHLIWSDAIKVLPKAPDAIFSVVRDPVARMASEHRWHRNGRRAPFLGKCLARLPFSLWLRLMLAIAKENPHAFDNHFQPQSAFVPARARVFRLEDGLEPVLHWLTVLVGEPSVDQAPHAIPSGKSTSVNARDAALVRAVYNADYQRFGYECPGGSAGRLAVPHRLAKALAWLDRRGML